MRMLPISLFDRMLCAVTDNGWRTRYDAKLQAYVIVTENGEFAAEGKS